MLLDALGAIIRKKKPTLAILTIEPSVQYPYLAEREQFFQEAVSRRGWAVKNIVRSRSVRHPDLADATHDLFEQTSTDAVFVPEVLYYAHLMTYLRSRSSSRRPKLLMTDSVDAQEGVIAVKQNIDEMAEVALRWAAAPKIQSLQTRVEPTLIADGR
jgi:hypothetical protein